MKYYFVTMDRNAGILISSSDENSEVAVQAARESLQERHLEKKPNSRSLPFTLAVEMNESDFLDNEKELLDGRDVQEYVKSGGKGYIWDYPAAA